MHKSLVRIVSWSMFSALILSACAEMAVEDTQNTPESSATASQPAAQKPDAALAALESAQAVQTKTAVALPTALRGLPRYAYGDGVDWVKALRSGTIAPHASVSGSGEMSVMDADIPIVVKGTMADVLFPHKGHTEWLACGNCHVGLYQMQRGINAVGMVKISQGESCGVCHGRVAFPLDDCERCHSQPKKVAKS